MANVEMKLEVDMRGMRAAMDAVTKVRDLPAEVQKDYLEALGCVAIHYMRAMGGDDYARGWMEHALSDLDRPPLLQLPTKQ